MLLRHYLVQLLLQLTKAAVSSSIQCHNCEPLLESLLYQLKKIINCNKGKVLNILQGTQLEAKFSKMDLQVFEFVYKESGVLVYPPEVNACPFVITIFVCFWHCTVYRNSLPSSGKRLKCHCYSISNHSCSKIQLQQ